MKFQKNRRITSVYSNLSTRLLEIGYSLTQHTPKKHQSEKERKFYMKSRSQVTFFNLLASFLGATGVSLLIGLPSVAQMPESSSTPASPTEAIQAGSSETPAVSETESTETPAVSETESTETPAVSETESTETPAVSETESTETPAVSETESTETPAVSETESPDVPKVMNAEPIETPASEELAPAESVETPSPEMPGVDDTTQPTEEPAEQGK
jgi:cytoskeletal protein RodZ